MDCLDRTRLVWTGLVWTGLNWFGLAWLLLFQDEVLCELWRLYLQKSGQAFTDRPLTSFRVNVVSSLFRQNLSNFVNSAELMSLSLSLSLSEVWTRTRRAPLSFRADR